MGRVAKAVAWSFFEGNEDQEFVCSTTVRIFGMGLSSYVCAGWASILLLA